MKIAILLPQKEKYNKLNAGSVSIFVNNHLANSNFKKKTRIYGIDVESPLDRNNFVSLFSNKQLFTNKSYIYNFIKKITNNIDVIEIHNRPKYFLYLKKQYPDIKFILYIHNDPNDLEGSSTVSERQFILSNCDKIICLSKWIKSKFVEGLDNNELSKIEIFYPGIKLVKKFNSKKKNIIIFVGKLNKDKGYHIYLSAASSFVKKNKNWKAISVGSESRRSISKVDNVNELGDLSNDEVLKLYDTASIAVANSTRNEPLGRLQLEATSRGCVPIVSNTGGLTETLDKKNSYILKNNTSEELLSIFKELTKKPTLLKKTQKKIFNNFNYELIKQTKILDNIRKNIFITNQNMRNFSTLKILHITNFNERFDGRLHYNTGKRLNNGFIREGFNVLTLSDRDFLSQNKNLFDPSGKKILNKKIIKIFNNFTPDFIVMGHSDNVDSQTLVNIKINYPETKIAQWFLDPLSKEGPDYERNKKRILKFANIIDANFLTTDPRSLNFKIKNSYYMPNPCDRSFETLKVFKKDTKNDLFFAISHGVHRGNLKIGKYDNRENFVSNLKSKLKELNFDIYGMNNREPVWSQNFIDAISNSSMALNLSRGKPIKYYSSDRIAQLIGNGLLTFIHKDVKYSDFFNKNEMIFYKNFKDLCVKLIFYKKNPKERKKIAFNGWKKYHKFFNSSIVARFIVDKTFSRKNKYKYIWDKSP